MVLNDYLARTKLQIFKDLSEHRAPSLGTCDEARLASLWERSGVQMGTTVLAPRLVAFEFVFRHEEGGASVFSVAVEPPERIVYLPVPAWVVESVWQGEVSGSHHFESDARRLVEELGAQIEPVENARLFERQPPKRRE